MIGFLAGARRGLADGVHRSWQTSLTSTGQAPGRLLAWAAAAQDRFVITGTGTLSIGSPAAGHDDRPGLLWQHIGWHRIERGGFDADSSTLRWTCYPAGDEPSGPEAGPVTGGESNGALVLERPGRVPVVFRDRVGASIIVEQFVPLSDRPAAPGRRLREPGVIISGRRDLANPDATISWHASLPQGIHWDTAGIRELAAESIMRLRSEYDPNG